MKFGFFLFIALLFSQNIFADSISIQGMSCSSCEKQIRAAICMDKEMSSWFETCDAKVTDTKKQIGEIKYILKKDVALDQTKMSKLTKAVEDTGRFVIKAETAKK